MKNKIFFASKYIFPFILCILLTIITLKEPSKKVQEPKNSGQVLGTNTIRGNNDSATSLKNLEKSSDFKLPVLDANSFLVYDQSNNTTLIEKNADEKNSIASLTKLLTALVVYENLDLGSIITVSQKDTEVKESPKLNLKAGERVKVIDLFNSMLVGSNNDAALALANQVTIKTKSAFNELMNKKAIELGMVNSKFSNPLGFDSEMNFSTANDLKKLINQTSKLGAFSNLGRTLLYEFQTENGRIIKTKTTNRILTENIDLEAIKTGFTPNSRGSMAVKLKAFDRNIIIIVLGSNRREYDVISLKNVILKYFRN